MQNEPFGHTGNLDQDDMREMIEWEEWHGVSEVLPVQAWDKDPFVFEMVERAEERGLVPYCHSRLHRDGPMQALMNLIRTASDHEVTSADELIEKARLGDVISLRGFQLPDYGGYGEGLTRAKALELLEPVINEVIDTRRFTINSDVAEMVSLQEDGHLDFIIRLGVKLGINPLTMMQMATINAAEYSRLDHLIGSITPGKLADVLIVDNLADVNVRMTMVNGEVVAENGRMSVELSNPDYPEAFYNTVRLGKVPEAADFKVEASGGRSRVRVLCLPEDPEIKEAQGMDIETVGLPVHDGAIQPDPARDIVKVVVMDRHNLTGAIGLGFVRHPAYIKRGAMGLTYNCQIEDLVIAGTSDEDIAQCARAIQRMGGGWCAVLDGEVLAKVEMPLCGLMTEEPFEESVDKMRAIKAVAQDKLGADLENSFLDLSMIALCITHCPPYRLGRHGLVKAELAKHGGVVGSFEKVPLFVDSDAR
jgi:adenine deaminase